MANNGQTTATAAESAPQAWHLAFLLVLGWVARYWHFLDFGWYEDDLTIIPAAVEMNARQLWEHVFVYITHLYGHGRPLSDSLIYVLSNLGYRLAGIPGIYLVGYLIFAGNILLFYFLVRRVGGVTLAFLASLAYVLFSADTTQAFHTHSLGAQPSITLLLIAFHLYLSEHRLAACLVAGLILFSYESPFLVFLGAPLLADRPWRSTWRPMLAHVMILFAMLAGATALRVAIGEERVTEIGFPAVLIVPLTHMVQGPLVSLGTYAYRPIQALLGAPLQGFLFGVGTMVAVALLVRRLPSPAGVPVRQLLRDPRHIRETVEASPPLARLLRLLIAGMIMLVMAYPLTFTVRAYAISGRDTRVHLAAVVGAAVVIGVGLVLLLALADAFRRRVAAEWLIGLLAGFLVAYGFVIQQDYRRAWTYQQELWTRVLRLVPDLEEGTTILVDPQGLKDVRQIGANTWNLPRILDQILEFPEAWSEPSRVYRLAPGWEGLLAGENGTFVLDGSTTVAPPSLYKEVSPASVVLLTAGDNGLQRHAVTLKLASGQFELKPLGRPTTNSFSKGFLHRYLILDAEP